MIEMFDDYHKVHVPIDQHVLKFRQAGEQPLPEPMIMH